MFATHILASIILYFDKCIVSKQIGNSIYSTSWAAGSAHILQMTCQLTIEKMDRINFLLTEVSLECLGNRFFDIYGDQSDTLLQLIEADSLKSKTMNADQNTALYRALAMESTVRCNQPVARKRRASFSNNSSDVSLGLLEQTPADTIFALPTSPAKVTRRRFTVNVSQLHKQSLKMQSPVGVRTNSASVQEIMDRLRNDIISSEFIAALSVSFHAGFDIIFFLFMDEFYRNYSHANNIADTRKKMS